MYKSIKTLFFLSVLVSAFILSTVSHAETIWEKRKKTVEEITGQQQEEPAPAIEAVSTDFQALIDPSDIVIPEQYGTIIETHKGASGKLIVHIQDAHANYEAQKNLAGILETLILDNDLGFVLREGVSTNVDLSHLRDYGSPEARERAAEKLLRNADITGEEYLELTSSLPISYGGIEDESLYIDQIDALWEIDKFKDLATEYVDKLIMASDALKPQIYNKDLIELDNKKKGYDAEEIDLLEYYEYLYSKAEQNDIPLYTFPNFQNLIKASNIEKQIDLVKIRSGEASAEDTGLYSEYLELTRDLNINSLFKEEPMLEEFLEDTLTENSDQRKLLKVSKTLSIVKNLLRIKVVPEEYKYFEDNKGDFDPQSWSDFLKKKAGELNLSLSIPANHYVISDNMPKIERFYNIAAEREKVFLKRIHEHIKNEGVDLVALIAGGFHTPMLTKLLADNGFSYVVVSPRVTTETDEELYRAALKR